MTEASTVSRIDRLQRWLLMLIGVNCLMRTCHCDCSLGNADIHPRQQHYATGTNLRLYCTLKEDAGIPNSSFIVFDGQGNSDLPVGSRQYSYNESTLALEIDNVTSELTGSINCRCHGENKSLRTLYIEVDDAPKVNGVKCVSQNFQDMTCRFCNPDTDLVGISWEMNYTLQSASSSATTYCSFQRDNLIDVCTCYICGTYNATPLPEQFDCSRENQFIPNAAYRITVTASNKFGLDTNDFLVFADPNIVKPNPVQDLGLRGVSNTSANAHWSAPAELTDVLLEYEVNVSSTTDWVDDSQTHLSYKTRLYVDGLTPFTDYILVVRSRPQSDNYTGFWSDVRNKTFRTLEYVPEIGPPLPVGNFRSTECSDSFDDDCRTVHVFWKSIPKELRHGEILCHTVEYESLDDSGNVVVPVSESNFSGTLPDLLQTQEYMIRVTASTSVGAGEAETFYLSQAAHMPEVPAVVAEHTASGSIYMEWKVMGANCPVDNFTLWRCDGTPQRPDLCKSNPEVENIAGTARNHTIENPGKDEVFSLTVNTASVSSGMTHDWICAYEYNYRPGQPKIVSVSQDGFGLRVDWRLLQCTFSQKTGRPFSYRVFLEDNQTNTRRNISVPAHVSSCFFDELLPSINYTVHMEAISAAGEGPVSNYVSHYLKDTPELRLVLVMIVGSLLGLIIFIFIIWCVCRQRDCFKRNCCRVDVHRPEKIDVNGVIDVVITNEVEPKDKGEMDPGGTARAFSFEYKDAQEGSAPSTSTKSTATTESTMCDSDQSRGVYEVCPEDYSNTSHVLVEVSEEPAELWIRL